jgi:hypothetical protein
MSPLEKFQHYKAQGGLMGYEEWKVTYYKETSVFSFRKLLIILLVTACLLLLLSACAASRSPLSLKVIYHKDGYTYASSSYRTYRARLDTFLQRGTIITVMPCGDSVSKQVFKRVN